MTTNIQCIPTPVMWVAPLHPETRITEEGEIRKTEEGETREIEPE